MTNSEHNNKGFSSAKIFTYFILTIIFIFTSFLSILFVYHLFGNKTSFLTFQSFSYIVVIKLIILLTIYFTLDGLRLFYILKTLGIGIDFKYIIKLVFVNIFVSNITPFATGGGFAQIYFLNKKGVSLGDAVAVTTIRTVLPIVFFFITTPVILLMNKDVLNIFPNNSELIYAPILAFVYMAIVYMFYKVVYNTKIIKGMVYKFSNYLQRKKIISTKKVKSLRVKFFNEIDNFSQSIRTYFSGECKYIFMSIVFTIIFLFSLFMFSVILISALNYNVSPLTIISLQIIVTFITYFAPTPGATGIAEGGYTLIFSNFIKKADIVSLTFEWRFFTIYIGMIIGMIIFYLEMIKSNIGGYNE